MNEELEVEKASRARIPAGSLGALASLRARAGVRVDVEGERAWIDWEPGDRRVLERVLPIAGVELFRIEAGKWFALGSRLPASPQPVLRDPMSLHRALTPAPFVPETCAREPATRVKLSVKRDDRVRPASALRCRLEDLAAWAEHATSHALREVEAAHAGEAVVLRGKKLPSILRAERFWGARVLRPLGFVADPDLPESALASALGLAPDEIALLDEKARVAAVPVKAFSLLSRAAVRAALRSRNEP